MDESRMSLMDNGEQTPLKQSDIKPCARWRGALAITSVGFAAVLVLGLVTQGGHSSSTSAAADDDTVPSSLVKPLVVDLPGDVEYSAAEDAEWLEFKARFRKAYASPDEEALRRTYYHARVAEIAEKNAKNGKPVFGVTAHTDRAPGTNAFARGREGQGTFETYKDSYEKFDLEKWKAAARSVDWATANAGVVDWRAIDDVLTPVKNQGQCGSCWAFSVTEQIESQFYLAGAPQPVVLSAQQVTSCTSEADDLCCFGCAGGDTSAAYEYVKSAVGLAPAAYVPYTQGLVPADECLTKACTETCDYDLFRLEADYFYIGPYATIEGYAFATDPCGAGLCEDQNLEELAAVTDATPVSVCLDAASWDDYTGGVLRADSCSSAYIDVDHCVQLVGYDAEAEEPYWLVRNSWSTSWGENGYIRLQLDANTCGIADEATVAKVSGVW